MLVSLCPWKQAESFVNPVYGASRSRGRLTGLKTTLLICGVLVLGALASLWLIFNTEPQVEREAAVRQAAMLVDVTSPESGTFLPMIESTGTVVPAREVMLAARVSGEVTGLSPNFVPGGFARQGEVLLRIDAADYEAALEQRESELQQAIAELEIEQGRQDMAERDYRQLQRELEPEKKALVLREPQLRSAEARVRSARAAVDQARLDLERTTLRAPFDAQVIDRDVNLGSQVSPGDSLARLVGVDTYWVETTVPLDKLRWLQFPGEGGDAAVPGSAVSIRHRTAWAPGEAREGQLFRLIGELEGDTRLARVLVAVDDPLALDADAVGVPGLIIGSFVECLIRGRALDGAVRLPREHVRQGDTVWVADGDRLAIRALDIVFEDAEFAYVRDGLAADDRVITTSLATVREGVPLRLRSPGGGAAAEAQSP